MRQGQETDCSISRDILTDSNCEGEQAEPSHGILEKIWAAGTQKGGAGAVVLAVVRRVEAMWAPWKSAYTVASGQCSRFHVHSAGHGVLCVCVVVGLDKA